MSIDHEKRKIGRLTAWLLPPLLFFCLLGLVFSSRPNWGAPPPMPVGAHLAVPDQPFTGNVDTKIEPQAAGYLLMSGWVAATAPGQRVSALEIYLDGTLAARVAEFYPRPDVAQVYSRPDFDLSGWRYILSTQRLKPGQHSLEFRPVTADGKSAILTTKELRILE